jgi:hypothetical protein
MYTSTKETSSLKGKEVSKEEEFNEDKELAAERNAMSALVEGKVNQMKQEFIKNGHNH